MKPELLLLPPRSTKRRRKVIRIAPHPGQLDIVSATQLGQGEVEGFGPCMSGLLECGNSGGAACAAGYGCGCHRSILDLFDAVGMVCSVTCGCAMSTANGERMN